MLKFILPITCAIIMPSWFVICTFLFSFSMFLIPNLFFSIYLYKASNFLLMMDAFSVMLIILSMWVTFLMFMASNKLKEKKKNENYLSALMLSLLLILICAFSVNNMFLFYIFFEASLLPTMLIIMGWGYQPERLNASLYLLLYTVTASLPLLCAISNMYMMSFSLFILNSSSIQFLTNTTSVMFIIAFLVKMPMFISHLWLPKAHVEAPVAGSMILASILLKLGAYGIIRIMYLQKNLMGSIAPIISAISLWGMVVTSFICMRQHDMKSLIAYSSVGHMALVILGLMVSYNWGWEGAIIMLLAHGLASSGLFAITNSYYEVMNTRSMFITKGMTSLFPVMAMWWFILCIANMGAPPSLNLLSEVMLLISIVSSSLWMSWFLSMSMFLAAAYSLILFTSLHHGSTPSFISPLTLHLSRNSMISLFHSTPLFLLFLSPSILSIL